MSLHKSFTKCNCPVCKARLAQAFYEIIRANYEQVGENAWVAKP